MRFVHIDDANFIPTQALKQELKLLNKSNPFLWVCLTQQLLTLFPTQTTRLEDVAQRVAADLAAQLSFNPST